jgi:hypothetical protein
MHRETDPIFHVLTGMYAVIEEEKPLADWEICTVTARCGVL